MLKEVQTEKPASRTISGPRLLGQPLANGLWQGSLYQAIGAAMWEIRAERANDEAAIERLVDSGFGPGRFAKTAYRLREGVAPDSRLSFVAEDPKTHWLLGVGLFW